MIKDPKSFILLLFSLITKNGEVFPLILVGVILGAAAVLVGSKEIGKRLNQLVVQEPKLVRYVAALSLFR